MTVSPATRTISESTFDDTKRKAYLSSGQVINQFHQSTVCASDRCPVHKPTEHDLRQYALRFNMDSFLFERIVPSQDGQTEHYIPDPDDFNLNKNNGRVIYRNAAICRLCRFEVVSYSKYDTNTCECGELTVEGGHEEMRRIGEGWIENSVIFENGHFI